MPEPLTQDQLTALREYAALSKDDRLKDALRHIDALAATTLPTSGCSCTWHSEDRGGGYFETVVEYEPACPEHSEHVWNPRTQMWELREGQPTTKADLMAALIRGFEAGYDIGAQTDETPRHLQSLRAALNAGDPDVAEAFWASKAWTGDERKAVKRAARAWLRFAEVMGR